MHEKRIMEEHGTNRKPARGPSALVRRLLRRLKSPPPAADEHAGDVRPPAPGPLAPEGRRSGEGTESIAPYLDQARNSRPTPLE